MEKLHNSLDKADVQNAPLFLPRNNRDNLVSALMFRCVSILAAQTADSLMPLVHYH